MLRKTLKSTTRWRKNNIMMIEIRARNDCARLIALLLVMLATQFAIAADSVRQPVERLGASTTSRRDDPAAALQHRLKGQVAKGISIDIYAVALAQTWLDYARESYFRKDRLAHKEALDEAKTIIEKLESQGAQVEVDARITSSSSRLRDDLWLKAASTQAARRFPLCNVADGALGNRISCGRTSEQ